MKARQENSEIKTYTLSQITDIVSPQYASEATFEENNYYDVVEPPYDTKTQILVNLHKVEDDKIFTYDVQDLTSEEIAEKQSELKLSRYIEIDKQVKVLSYGAIGIILGIKGLTDEEMQARMNLYKILYDACSESNPEPETIDLIEAKRALFNLGNNMNLDLPTYKALVISKWEEGQTAFDNFNLMIEAVRTKWKLVVLDDTKYNQIKTIITTIDGDTSKDDVPVIFNQIMAV